MTLALVLRLVALLAVLTAAVIGFIAGFATNPVIDWSWTLFIVPALIAAAFALRWVAELVKV